MQKIAVVTEKATGHRYEVYAVASDSDPSKTYAVGVRGNYACRCTCKDRKFHPTKSCKHMKLIQRGIDEQRSAAPLLVNRYTS